MVHYFLINLLVGYLLDKHFVLLVAFHFCQELPNFVLFLLSECSHDFEVLLLDELLFLRQV